MIVNHYVVAWTQLAGLAIGLYGVFFLSVTNLGSRGASYLRPLLPAAGVAVAMAVSGSIQAFLVSQHVYVAKSLLGPAIPVWLWAGATYVAAYVVGLWAQRTPPSKRKNRLILWSVPGIVVFLVCSIAFDLFIQQTSLANTAVDLGENLVGVGGWALVFFAHGKPDKTPFHTMGVMFSATAVVVQFIPPLLDVLNIAVK